MAASIVRKRMKLLSRILFNYTLTEAAVGRKVIFPSLMSSTRHCSQRSIDSDFKSLASKGFLRPVKGYKPPPDVEKQVLDICATVLNRTSTEGLILRTHQLTSDPVSRFKILSNCISRFDHDIPNSQLHKMNTVDDLIGYFESPVKTSTVFEDYATASDLPPNLYVQREYIRFHPETDTKFDGISAFGRNDNIVSGLKARKKYKGFQLSKSWPPPKE